MLIAPVPWRVPRAETDGIACDSLTGPMAGSRRQRIDPGRSLPLRLLGSVRSRPWPL